MRNIKKILCPVDFSEASAHAVRSAQELAQLVGGTLVVAHVLDEPAYSLDVEGEQVSTLVSEYEKAMKAKLAEVLATLDGSVPVQGKMVCGSPAEAIAKLAESEGCHLIVMGTHGRTGLRHMLLGSVTERVLRVADVPVLTLRAPR